MTDTKKQIKNAIKWIDNLPNYKQAPYGNRMKLGNAEDGYCCLGAGCKILNIPYIDKLGLSVEFKHEVGLKYNNGMFIKEDQTYYDCDSLTSLNDITKAGFKRITKLMKSHPEWMFEPEVAKGIKQHYTNERTTDIN